MDSFFKTVKHIWRTATLRRRILFTLFAIAIFRVVVHVPVPGANLDNIATLIQQNQLLGVFSALTGGSVEQFSIVAMGLSPYITASIIVQLLTVVVPSLENLTKEGDQGRRQLNQYTRYLTIPFAFLQSYGVIVLLNAGNQTQGGLALPVLADTSPPSILFTMAVLVTGTMFLLWLGDLITEYGIGNGTSVVIFAGIVASIPTVLGPSLSLILQSVRDAQTIGEAVPSLLPTIAILVLTLILTAVIVYISEGQRQIPITYAGRQITGAPGASHLPLRVNQAGMIPIIFAVSFTSFPGLIASFFQNATSEWLRNISSYILLQFNQGGAVYMIMYCLLVIAFTFFYVNLTFRTDQVAENIQKRGGFVPGIRPGQETASYLRAVSNRITVLGAVFLGVIAVLPILAQQLTTTYSSVGAPLLVSGAGLIIVVGVVLDVVRQINAQLVMQDYERLY